MADVSPKIVTNPLPTTTLIFCCGPGEGGQRYGVISLAFDALMESIQLFKDLGPSIMQNRAVYSLFSGKAVFGVGSGSVQGRKSPLATTSQAPENGFISFAANPNNSSPPSAHTSSAIPGKRSSSINTIGCEWSDNLKWFTWFVKILVCQNLSANTAARRVKN